MSGGIVSTASILNAVAHRLKVVPPPPQLPRGSRSSTYAAGNGVLGAVEYAYHAGVIAMDTVVANPMLLQLLRVGADTATLLPAPKEAHSSGMTAAESRATLSPLRLGGGDAAHMSALRAVLQMLQAAPYNGATQSPSPRSPDPCVHKKSCRGSQADEELVMLSSVVPPAVAARSTSLSSVDAAACAGGAEATVDLSFEVMNWPHTLVETAKLLCGSAMTIRARLLGAALCAAHHTQSHQSSWPSHEAGKQMQDHGDGGYDRDDSHVARRSVSLLETATNLAVYHQYLAEIRAKEKKVGSALQSLMGMGIRNSLAFSPSRAAVEAVAKWALTAMHDLLESIAALASLLTTKGDEEVEAVTPGVAHAVAVNEEPQRMAAQLPHRSVGQHNDPRDVGVREREYSLNNGDVAADVEAVQQLTSHRGRSGSSLHGRETSVLDSLRRRSNPFRSADRPPGDDLSPLSVEHLDDVALEPTAAGPSADRPRHDSPGPAASTAAAAVPTLRNLANDFDAVLQHHVVATAPTSDDVPLPPPALLRDGRCRSPQQVNQMANGVAVIDGRRDDHAPPAKHHHACLDRARASMHQPGQEPGDEIELQRERGVEVGEPSATDHRSPSRSRNDSRGPGGERSASSTTRHSSLTTDSLLKAVADVLVPARRREPSRSSDIVTERRSRRGRDVGRSWSEWSEPCRSAPSRSRRRESVDSYTDASDAPRSARPRLIKFAFTQSESLEGFLRRMQLPLSHVIRLNPHMAAVDVSAMLPPGMQVKIFVEERTAPSEAGMAATSMPAVSQWGHTSSGHDGAAPRRRAKQLAAAPADSPKSLPSPSIDRASNAPAAAPSHRATSGSAIAKPTLRRPRRRSTSDSGGDGGSQDVVASEAADATGVVGDSTLFQLSPIGYGEDGQLGSIVGDSPLVTADAPAEAAPPLQPQHYSRHGNSPLPSPRYAATGGADKDTLRTIADHYGMPVAAIREANALKTAALTDDAVIPADTVLRIPTARGRRKSPEDLQPVQDTIASIAARFSVSIIKLRRANPHLDRHGDDDLLPANTPMRIPRGKRSCPAEAPPGSSRHVPVQIPALQLPRETPQVALPGVTDHEPSSTAPVESPLITSRHECFFIGEAWSSILTTRAALVRHVFVEDVCDLLSVPGDAVRDVVVAPVADGGSSGRVEATHMVVNFVMTHSRSLPRCMIEEELGRHDFPRLARLYEQHGGQRSSTPPSPPTQATECPGITPVTETTHTKVFPGDRWERILRSHSTTLQRLFAEEVCQLLGVAESDVRGIAFALGSLHVGFRLRHPEIMLEETVNTLLEAHEFPSVKRLYYTLAFSCEETGAEVAAATVTDTPCLPEAVTASRGASAGDEVVVTPAEGSFSHDNTTLARQLVQCAPQQVVVEDEEYTRDELRYMELAAQQPVQDQKLEVEERAQRPPSVTEASPPPRCTLLEPPSMLRGDSESVPRVFYDGFHGPSLHPVGADGIRRITIAEETARVMRQELEARERQRITRSWWPGRAVTGPAPSVRGAARGRQREWGALRHCLEVVVAKESILRANLTTERNVFVRRLKAVLGIPVEDADDIQCERLDEPAPLPPTGSDSDEDTGSIGSAGGAVVDDAPGGQDGAAGAVPDAHAAPATADAGLVLTRHTRRFTGDHWAVFLRDEEASLRALLVQELGHLFSLPSSAVSDVRLTVGSLMIAEFALQHSRRLAAHVIDEALELYEFPELHRRYACIARTILPSLSPVPERPPLSGTRSTWRSASAATVDGIVLSPAGEETLLAPVDDDVFIISPLRRGVDYDVSYLSGGDSKGYDDDGSGSGAAVPGPGRVVPPTPRPPLPVVVPMLNLDHQGLAPGSGGEAGRSAATSPIAPSSAPPHSGMFIVSSASPTYSPNQQNLSSSDWIVPTPCGPLASSGSGNASHLGAYPCTLAQLAAMHRVTVDQIRDTNPHLRCIGPHEALPAHVTLSIPPSTEGGGNGRLADVSPTTVATAACSTLTADSADDAQAWDTNAAGLPEAVRVPDAVAWASSPMAQPLEWRPLQPPPDNRVSEEAEGLTTLRGLARVFGTTLVDLRQHNPELCHMGDLEPLPRSTTVNVPVGLIAPTFDNARGRATTPSTSARASASPSGARMADDVVRVSTSSTTGSPPSPVQLASEAGRDAWLATAARGPSSHAAVGARCRGDTEPTEAVWIADGTTSLALLEESTPLSHPALVERNSWLRHCDRTTVLPAGTRVVLRATEGRAVVHDRWAEFIVREPRASLLRIADRFPPVSLRDIREWNPAFAGIRATVALPAGTVVRVGRLPTTEKAVSHQQLDALHRAVASATRGRYWAKWIAWCGTQLLHRRRATATGGGRAFSADPQLPPFRVRGWVALPETPCGWGAGTAAVARLPPAPPSTERDRAGRGPVAAGRSATPPTLMDGGMSRPQASRGPSRAAASRKASPSTPRLAARSRSGERVPPVPSAGGRRASVGGVPRAPAPPALTPILSLLGLRLSAQLQVLRAMGDAYEAGIRPNDVIVEVNRRRVLTLEDVNRCAAESMRRCDVPLDARQATTADVPNRTGHSLRVSMATPPWISVTVLHSARGTVEPHRFSLSRALLSETVAMAARAPPEGRRTSVAAEASSRSSSAHMGSEGGGASSGSRRWSTSRADSAAAPPGAMRCPRSAASPPPGGTPKVLSPRPRLRDRSTSRPKPPPPHPTVRGASAGDLQSERRVSLGHPSSSPQLTVATSGRQQASGTATRPTSPASSASAAPLMCRSTRW